MSKPSKQLSPTYVRSLLSYNKRTGLLRWKKNRRPRGKSGAIAGCFTKDGYVIVGIDGAMYGAHRLAYVIVKGEWPPDQIDHKNLDRSNNRWKNIRAATHGQNKQNQKPNKNNSSGFKGVYKHSDCARWGAMIQIDNKKTHLGLFKTPQEASLAYKAAAKTLHKEFHRY